MRIAIVDDLSGERALLREQLARQLARRGAEAELLEFDSGEAFLAAEKERRFTAAFLDIYMEGMTGMEAARALRKTDTDCLLVFTTTSTDHALEGFQVRALHYLVKPFAEGEIDALTDELLARVPQPEKFMELRVEGGEIRLRYRDIIRAEHFATPSSSQYPTTPVAFPFSHSSALRTAYFSSQTSNISESLAESPKQTARAKPSMFFSRTIASAFVAPRGRISSQWLSARYVSG